jgi:predicted permease
VFEGVAGYGVRSAAVGDEGAREPVMVEAVAPAYLELLGVRPALGRAFTAEEARGAGATAVVISDALWRRRFGADPGVVGSTVAVNARPATVVGVLPPRFAGRTRAVAVDVWVPLAVAARLRIAGIDAEDFATRGTRSFEAVARLAPGVSLERARQAMDVVARQLRAAYPDAWTDVRKEGRRITVLTDREARVPPGARGPVLAFTGLLGGAVGLVLLVCCANVAGLLLARGTGRGREIGVRLSLGARPARLARQFLTESLALAALGTALALVLTAWATRLIGQIQPSASVRLALDVAPDWRVLAFSALLALLAAVAFGLAPALRAARTDVTRVMRSGGTYGASSRTRLQGALVAAQLATSLVLLVGALLFVNAVRAAGAADPGFSARALLLVDLRRAPGAESGPPAAGVARQVQERLAGAPGVESVSWASAVPFGGGFSRRSMGVEGYRPADGEDMEFPYNVVGPAYFETMGVALARGRGFTAADRAESAPVVVVNEAFARKFWPGQDALGKRVSVRGGRPPFAEVVGVARDGRYRSLTDAPRPYVYIPALQQRDEGLALHVRTAGDPRAVLPAVRRAVAELAPGWELTPERTIEEHVAASLLPQRVASWVLGAFGGLALVLASVGVYGVVAYAAARRTREIGVRVALGASRGDVVRMVVRQNLGLVAWGVGVGLPLAWGAGRLLGSLLLGAGVASPLAFGAGTLFLVGTATLAAWLPARRAARVDPISALRTE